MSLIEKESASRGRATARSRRKSIERLAQVAWDFEEAKTNSHTHSLHPYPAKFIPQIPRALIEELSEPGDTVADIFCGSGTTLVEALRLGRHAIGIDANPIAALISQAKTRVLSPGQHALIQNHLNECASTENIVRDIASRFFGETAQTFISNGWRPSPDMCEFWFMPHVVEELAELRRLIGEVKDEGVRTLCNVSLSAIIVSVSKQDSDTRYVRREKKILPGDTFRRYSAQVRSAVEAMKGLSDTVSSDLDCKVYNQNILDGPETEPFDLVVTSPPYPNAYSYHLYHRTRLLWLGADQEAFKRIEIGSHRKYSAKGEGRATEHTFRSEMESIFRWLRNRLRKNGYACFVIGDSTLSGKKIDNATLIAKASFEAGFSEVGRFDRTICATKKAFNPKIGKIKSENVLILRNG